MCGETQEADVTQATRLKNSTERRGATVPGIVVDPVAVASTIRSMYAAKAISSLSNPRTLEDGRTILPRLSANDCYVALEEACHKMARVAARKISSEPALGKAPVGEALGKIFPEPVAYLIRAIRSVVADAEREVRRETPAISFDQPLGYSGDGAFTLKDTLSDDHLEAQPEAALIDADERLRFRKALATALKSVSPQYLAALERDMTRNRGREEGLKTPASTDRERQTVCRARAALSEILKRECGLDNPFIQLIAQGRGSRVRRNRNGDKNDWNSARQDALYHRLLETAWTERTDTPVSETAEEAIVNEVSAAKLVAPPSPEMRQTLRVMDTYTLSDNPTASITEAQSLYDQAREARNLRNDLDGAIRLYRQAFTADPKFFAALSEVGVLLSQQGNLREALDVYLAIIEDPNAGDNKFIAATNAADIFLTWYDMGRTREKNIERALHYAQMAMQKPSPMRACNLLIAYVKDKYYREAQQVMDMVLHNSIPGCSGEKFLQTLFQIRDADLVAWWNWLDEELGKDAN